ncbi:hypothetical protein HanXRQr2_Chr01g0001251 [Helianthus annuus]|uniref:Uncharacterized protein n=1 Tax=Helianthus annuus TaxID=4232 RepID=A0A9K3JSB8_HELAN|nr:hypothetical protein HanXRQr2_Chr01g0001251 [Helianthus annuus]KAJ0955292.1 hypothetical protein HanPSC8_Chr01g0001211 [Helianthus annuus]
MVVLLWLIGHVCRVNSYGTNLTTLKSRRDSLYSKLSEVLVAKEAKVEKMDADLKVRYESAMNVMAITSERHLLSSNRYANCFHSAR